MGDMERAKEWVTILGRSVLKPGDYELSKLLDRLVRRVEDLQSIIADIVCKLATEKSLLATAEKAIEDMLDLATVESLVGEPDARRDNIFASAGEALSKIKEARP